ncbi:hypothetical protein B0J12DRAFT_266124 [Macrophomina phaseolina]|uniref:Uncharacterized protein n=1 Tax=Macrophomina phaseolina TaxID=35725 RepID=A0ABQ8G1K0_9PEZI|nr:hypothetical protein B0J12DRAFT_266124 [Macrophomina phaseolina]
MHDPLQGSARLTGSCVPGPAARSTTPVVVSGRPVTIPSLPRCQQLRVSTHPTLRPATSGNGRHHFLRDPSPATAVPFLLQGLLSSRRVVEQRTAHLRAVLGQPSSKIEMSISKTPSGAVSLPASSALIVHRHGVLAIRVLLIASRAICCPHYISLSLSLALSLSARAEVGRPVNAFLHYPSTTRTAANASIEISPAIALALGRKSRRNHSNPLPQSYLDSIQPSVNHRRPEEYETNSYQLQRMASEGYYIHSDSIPVCTTAAEE